MSNEQQPFVPRTPMDFQKLKLERLMQNPNKPVVIPESPREKKGFVVPEFVRNVMGSSAGAGSGEFHVYRHLRRKEYTRQKMIEEKGEKEKLDEAYQFKLEENKRKMEEKTAKNRAKRLKRKQSQKNKAKMKGQSKVVANENKSESESEEDSEDNDSNSENIQENENNEISSDSPKDGSSADAEYSEIITGQLKAVTSENKSESDSEEDSKDNVSNNGEKIQENESKEISSDCAKDGSPVEADSEINTENDLEADIKT